MSLHDELNQLRAQSAAQNQQQARVTEIGKFRDAFLKIEDEIASRVTCEDDVVSHLKAAAKQGKKLVLIAKVPYAAEKVAALGEPERSRVLREIALFCPALAQLFRFTDTLAVSVTFHGERQTDASQGRSWTNYYLALSSDPPISGKPQPLGFA